MSKTIIEVKCTDQVLTLTNTPVIATGGVGEDYVSVEFCSMWDGYLRVLLFWRKGLDPIPVVEDADGLFPVPAELTGVEGIVYFGAVGYDDDDNRRTSEAISYRLEAGAISEGTELPASSGDVFDQLMTFYADAKLYVSAHIDQAENAALAAEACAREALDAAENAEKAAEKAAANVVDAIEEVVYPGIVEATVNSDGRLHVPLDIRPPEKTFLTFRVPDDDGTAETLGFSGIYIVYPDADGVETKEFFWVEDGYTVYAVGAAIGFGDVVTVLLTRSADRGQRCYPLNSRITSTVNNKLQETSDRIGELIGAPGLAGMGAYNVQSDDGENRMMMNLGSVPVDGTLVRFVPDVNSEDTAGLRITAPGLGFDATFELVDADEAPVCNGVHTFNAGSYVIALLDVSNLKAYVLNPEHIGVETIKYTGNGQDVIRLSFSRSPKVVILMDCSHTEAGSAYAVFMKDLMIGRIIIHSYSGTDGTTLLNREDKILSIAGKVAWGRHVSVLFEYDNINKHYFNVIDYDYIAIGIM